MNKRTTIVLLMAAVGLILAAVPAAAEQYETSETLVFDVGASPSLKLKNISGDYTISGWDRSVIEVTYKKKSRGSSAKLKAELVRVVAEQTGDRVFVDVRYPDSNERRARRLDHSFDVSVDFNIRVPAACRIDAAGVSGDGTLLNIDGDVQAGTTSGDVKATALAGNVQLHTTSGDVVLSGGNGVIELNTTSGDIEVHGVRGRVKAMVTSGDIEIAAASLQEGVFKTVSGDIDISVEEPITAGTFTFSDFSGSITFTLPPDSAFEIEARTSSGDIETNFGIPVTGKYSKREMSGKVNGGGAIISAKTSVGDIEIWKK